MTVERTIQDILRRLDHLEALAQIRYETDTYTPTYVGGTTAGVTTYTAQIGAWTRKGREITVIGQIAWSAATGTGNARISLPFAVVSYNVPGALYPTNVTFANGSIVPLAAIGNSYFELASPLTNAAPTAVAVEAAGNLIYQISYIL